jgi:hypothetical protein
MIITGTREWADYVVRADLRPYLAAAWGLAARVQGRRRYVAVLFDSVGDGAVGHRVRLARMCGGVETSLAEAAFTWSPDKVYAVQLRVEGTRITARVDDLDLLTGEDDRLVTGGIALLVDTGSVGTDEIHVSPG